MTLDVVGDQVHGGFTSDLLAGELLQHAVEVQLRLTRPSEHAVVGWDEVVFQVGLDLLLRPDHGVAAAGLLHLRIWRAVDDEERPTFKNINYFFFSFSS